MLRKFRFSDDPKKNKNFTLITIFGLLGTINLIFFMLITFDIVDTFLRHNYKANKTEVLNLYNSNFTNIESFKEIFSKEKKLNQVLRWYDSKRMIHVIGREELIITVNHNIFKIEYPRFLKQEKVFVIKEINSVEFNTHLDNNGIIKSDLLEIVNFMIQHNLKAMGQGDGYFYILFQSDVYLKYLPSQELVRRQGNRIMQDLGFNWYMVAP